MCVVVAVAYPVLGPWKDGQLPPGVAAVSFLAGCAAALAVWRRRRNN
jgi:hypothetical protein